MKQLVFAILIQIYQEKLQIEFHLRIFFIAIFKQLIFAKVHIFIVK